MTYGGGKVAADVKAPGGMTQPKWPKRHGRAAVEVRALKRRFPNQRPAMLNEFWTINKTAELKAGNGKHYRRLGSSR